MPSKGRGTSPRECRSAGGLLVRFGDLVVENPRIREIDVNPLLASPEGLLALDARVVLHDKPIAMPSCPPAIRPYPTEYVSRRLCAMGLSSSSGRFGLTMSHW